MKVNDLLTHRFIVLSVDHYNPLGVVRSLGEEGIKPFAIVIAASGRTPCMIPNSKYIEGVSIVASIEEGYKYLIDNFSKEKEKPFVYSCGDDVEAYLDSHYNELKDHFYFFDGKSQGQITKVMEKNEMCRLAVQCGLDIPKTEEVKVGELPHTLRYPVMTKSVISTIENWKGNVHICQNETELLEAYKSIRGERINVQEFIKKKNELCIDGLSINGGEELYMPIQSSYLRFTPKGYGNYILFEKFKEEGLYNKIQSLFKLTKFSGIFSIEFLRDENDHFYFLEINFRNSTWSYAHTKMGINLPVIYAKSVLAGHLDLTGVEIKNIPFTAMSEFSDFGESVKTGKVSLWQWFKDVRSCGCLFTYNKCDKKPFWCLIRSILKHKVFRS